MRALTLALLTVGAAVCAGPARAQAASSAAPASAPSTARPSSGMSPAAAACERAARATMGSTRPGAADVSFTAAPAPVPGPADSVEVVLRGAGRVKTAAGSRPFSYNCNYDTRSAEVTGVVVRESTPSGDSAAPVVRSVEPDLSNVSPLACESAAAAALKKRWPTVTRIAFNPDTRSMDQDSGGNAALRGQGTAQPAADSPSTHFTYHCAVDPKSGRVLGTRIAN